MNYELIKFKNDDVELEVNVSPEEETVWLTKDQIAVLFDRDRTVISKHINKIYKDEELDINRTRAKNAQVQKEGSRSVTRTIELFNLDVVLSVGYRTSGKKAVAFRKWANSVLKEYLLKGYVLNEERTLVTKENYLGLVCRVDSLEGRINKIEQKEKHLFVEDQLVLDGEMFDALIVITRIIETAKESIVVVDPYVDIRTLNTLKNKNKDVSLEIITSQRANLSEIDIEIFTIKYGGFTIRVDDRFHDRYLIIDNELFYHIGGSVNCFGKRVSQITLIEDTDIVETLRKRIQH